MRVQRDVATKATAAKGELLAVATHDLKNPLTAIAGLAGLMLRLKKLPNAKASAADELEMLDSIHSSAKHMGEIVRGILANEGLEQGGVVFKPEPTDLAALVRQQQEFPQDHDAQLIWPVVAGANASEDAARRWQMEWFGKATLDLVTSQAPGLAKADLMTHLRRHMAASTVATGATALPQPRTAS